MTPSDLLAVQEARSIYFLSRAERDALSARCDTDEAKSIILHVYHVGRAELLFDNLYENETEDDCIDDDY